ncbi:Rrf2 family transcriptional regulator [Candidatus Poribacteria bacterium]|nr:Rrf2 family transcriptional regulator [Candidatus Poribacteria bacterium]
MRISSKARYALLAMCELASQPGETLSVAALAERQNIPHTFLEQLLLRLKRAGLTTSRRGPDGGYTLAENADRIRIGDIYTAIEGPIDLRADSREAGCADTERAAESVWQELEDAVLERLNGITLQDVADRSAQTTQEPVVAHNFTFSI